VIQARLQGGAEPKELALPAEGTGGKGGDQAGVGLRVSAGLIKRVRAGGRAGSHKLLQAMGDVQGGGDT
jgi:hypothetical protein